MGEGWLAEGGRQLKTRTKYTFPFEFYSLFWDITRNMLRSKKLKIYIHSNKLCPSFSLSTILSHIVVLNLAESHCILCLPLRQSQDFYFKV